MEEMLPFDNLEVFVKAHKLYNKKNIVSDFKYIK